MRRLTLTALFAGLALISCAGSQSPTRTETEATMPGTNPFFVEKWETPYEAPPFEQIKEEHYPSALDEGMRRQLEEVAAIASSPETPTFVNTVEALERTGAFLDRVVGVFFNLAEANTSDRLQEIRTTYAPRISMHEDQVLMDQALFGRVKTLMEQIESLDLSTEQRKLLVDLHRAFIRSGAALNPDARARLVEINARLAELYTRFGDHVRQENARYALVIENEDDLAGLPETVVSAASALASERGQEGKWAFTLVRSSCTPFLQYASKRALREQIYRAYIGRGAHGDELDNRELIKEIVVLRAERANLLGFETHAHYTIDDNMARTPEAVHALLDQLWRGAMKKAKQERDQLSKLLRQELGKNAKLEPWDWWYYSEKVRKARYDLSQDELKPYFQVDAVRQGAFDTASRLFGITFDEVTDRVPLYHPEVKAFDVKDADGSHVGLLYLDYHPRASKRGGAWMEAYRSQQNLGGRVRPIIVNVGNFPPPAGDKPALLGWDEVTTLFHEMGHALHGLLSEATYRSLSGTRTKRDYVELPSQLFENWASQPAVIKRYARHFRTGEPIPDELIAKLDRSRTFNQGFEVGEAVAAALLDLRWHTLSPAQATAITDVVGFDDKVASDLGLIPEIAPRYHAPYFQHIFSSDEYSAGYYVYSWAQVLEADAFKAFEESGDVFDPSLSQKLRRYIYGAGATDEEMKLYVSFRGREPRVVALLEKLGISAQ